MKAFYLTKTQEGTHLSSHVQIETLKVTILPKGFVEVTCLFARPFANDTLMATLPMTTRSSHHVFNARPQRTPRRAKTNFFFCKKRDSQGFGEKLVVCFGMKIWQAIEGAHVISSILKIGSPQWKVEGLTQTHCQASHNSSRRQRGFPTPGLN